MVDLGFLPPEAQDTANFFEDMNRLFDILNSRYRMTSFKPVIKSKHNISAQHINNNLLELIKKVHQRQKSVATSSKQKE